MHRIICLHIFTLVFFLFLTPAYSQELERISTPHPISNRTLSAEGILPADVLSRVGLVRDELELIRKAMGKPKSSQVDLTVSHATPREVYFQVLTLLEKMNRLSFEQIRQYGNEPKPVRTADLKSFHVWQVVDESLRLATAVKRKFDVKEVSQEVIHDETTTSSDVFVAVVRANRQLNALLERQFAPSDVFEQTTVAISYAARLLAHFPEATRIPDEPRFEQHKIPADVFKRLIRCFKRIQEIAHSSHLTIMDIDLNIDDIGNAKPSDVYNMASLVVSELSYFHSKLKQAQPRQEVYPFGEKSPSHVYQRVGILEAQLMELQKHIANDPDWLKE